MKQGYQAQENIQFEEKHGKSREEYTVSKKWYRKLATKYGYMLWTIVFFAIIYDKNTTVSSALIYMLWWFILFVLGGAVVAIRNRANPHAMIMALGMYSFECGPLILPWVLQLIVANH